MHQKHIHSNNNNLKPKSIMSENHPTIGNGKICYLEMPALNINISATFYKEVFGWNIRQRGDGATAFDDAVGEVSGAWIVGRAPMTEVGLLFYIIVDDIDAAIEKVIANGGKIVQAVGMDAPE